MNLPLPNLPPWLIPMITETLANPGLWAAKQLCKKFTGDDTCNGRLPLRL